MTPFYYNKSKHVTVEVAGVVKNGAVSSMTKTVTVTVTSGIFKVRVF